MAELNALTTNDASFLLLKFDDNQLPDFEKALQAPVCEFVRRFTLLLRNSLYLMINAFTGLHQTLG